MEQNISSDLTAAYVSKSSNTTREERPMPLDFGKLNAGSAAKQTDPRKIFTTLKRDARFRRPLDEQSDVLDEWYLRRDARDLTIKMNTGGGKTVVGLLCLQSSLNEKVKPAVYITPDSFLVAQVLAEAKALGITATDDEKDPDFVAGRSILVANVHKLFNGRSVFGVGEKKIPIGSVVIDDAHACLGVVNDQFCIKSKAGSPVYDELMTLFEEDLKAQSPSRFLDVKAEDPTVVMSVPYWAWRKQQHKVIELLHAKRKTNELEWSWPLLSECIPLCSCVFGGGRVEVAPHFVPIDRIPAFASAKRRIYMTATLADDTILVSHFQADASDVGKPIRPKGGGDIGDRMILAPQEINPAYTIEELKSLISEIAEEKNTVVIVPSKQRAEFWRDVANQILDKDSIQDGVEQLRTGHVGLTVLINKYDGIDLPGAACELLVIDGLPEVSSLSERLDMQILDGTQRQLVRQIQRIEQGMGRGVRSSDDHCVVLLLGGKLTQRLHQPGAEAMFSAATSAQIALGKDVAAQVRGEPIEKLRPILDLCLDEDDDWINAGRNAVVNAAPAAGGHLDANQVKLREAFDAVRIDRHDIAISKAQEAVNATTERAVKGYLMQQLAEYTGFTNEAKAQELQLAALGLNARLLKPMAGVTYDKLSAPPTGQVAAAIDFMTERFLEGNDLIIWVNGLLDDLNWGEEGTKRFEAAVFALGRFLGFGSQRPEDTTGRGPDNLWALGDLKYLVIECKSGATAAQRVSKADTNQLNGSIVWFDEKYDGSCSAIPIMIHPKTVFENAASPHKAIRIVNGPGLERLRNAIRAYSVSLAANGSFKDHKEVKRQLQHHKLAAGELVALCTVSQNSK
ncbi:DEAD/DEAH box helicase [Burkholderia ubonensis]|uniref:DEAD/DEAH box helicase n=1 Tax=Burkholderia ubonensis TaxID=101571 RepID=UPI001E2D096A|nr:DEAD/DEAH box helicase [Burkholderia ubonensis]